METSQDPWLARLRQTGEVQAAAIADLRELLLRNLAAAFQNDVAVNAAFQEDVAQDALLKVLDSLDQFEGRSKLTTWATTIAIRAAYTEIRRKRWKDVSLDQLVESHGDFFQSAPTAAQGETQREKFVDAMNSAIKNCLTDKQKEALVAELEGMPMEEIGRRTGSNRNAIYKLLHDARKRLRKELEANGFSAEEFWALREG